jgi:hypothetical protein
MPDTISILRGVLGKTGMYYKTSSNIAKQAAMSKKRNEGKEGNESRNGLIGEQK